MPKVREYEDSQRIGSQGNETSRVVVNNMPFPHRPGIFARWLHKLMRRKGRQS